MKSIIEKPVNLNIFIVTFFLLSITSSAFSNTINVTIEGIISPSSNNDIYQLDNANFSAVFSYDTDAVSIFSSSSNDVWITSFPFISSTINFTNRPSDAPNSTSFISLASSQQLSLSNSFTPSTVSDLVSFGGDLSGEFEGLKMDLKFVFDQNYFQSMTFPNLSDFNLLDGSPSAGGSLFYSPDSTATPFHRVTTFSNISVTAVPIPSSLILFISGIATLRIAGKRNS